MMREALLNWRARAVAFGGVIVFSALSLGSANGQNGPMRIGFPQDWSQKHFFYTNPTSFADQMRLQQDPRYFFQQWARAAHARKPKPGPGPGSPPDVDWSYSLQTGKVAAGMYPAKFSFDVNATADCTNDFVVFALEVAGNSTSASAAQTGTWSGAASAGDTVTIASNLSSGDPVQEIYTAVSGTP